MRVIRPGNRPLVLFDESLPGRDLPALAALSATVDVLAIRLRRCTAAGPSGTRWLTAGLPPLVADAAAVLDEGDALDVSAAADAVRLARVASRLRANGYPVAAIVYAGPHRPRTAGFAALRSAELAAATLVPANRPPSGSSIGDRLAAVGGSAATAGNRVEVELDNATARQWLLDALGAARERVHFQVYMALDDDVGTAVEAALAATAARGVPVRVLVDSLHGLHGSLGAHNPLLDRLASRPGVELRVSRPVTTLPSLEDLKQRNHRKLLIADGAVALVGGRNLSHEYYTGFGEVALTTRSLWREVPWLDAGARVEGPAVARLDEIFRDGWQEAGGAPFPITARPPAGSSPVRVISHDGLRDAATLEAFLALVDGARSHVYVINGFPLLLEIQHALLRALRRGVRVRTLFGNLTPTHAGIPFGGPWSSARMAATELVHSRQDLLVQHGAEAYRHGRAGAARLGAGARRASARTCTPKRSPPTGRPAPSAAPTWTSPRPTGRARSCWSWRTRPWRARSRRGSTGCIAASERVDRDDPEWRRRRYGANGCGAGRAYCRCDLIERLSMARSHPLRRDGVSRPPCAAPGARRRARGDGVRPDPVQIAARSTGTSVRRLARLERRRASRARQRPGRADQLRRTRRRWRYVRGPHRPPGDVRRPPADRRAAGLLVPRRRGTARDRPVGATRCRSRPGEGHLLAPPGQLRATAPLATGLETPLSRADGGRPGHRDRPAADLARHPARGHGRLRRGTCPTRSSCRCSLPWSPR